MAGKPVKVAFLADTADLRAGLKQAEQSLDGVGDKAKSAGQKMEAGINKGAKVAAAGFVALGAAGLGAALKAEEVASSNARVSNVLSNMGMDKATDRVLAYADSLEQTLGVDEKVIKDTQAILGTFSSLATSADEAGGAFDRATVLAQDMSAAGFGAADSAAKQLGKALQDPVKGIAALNKSGVTFTEQQKKQIEAMTKAGDAAGAQNLILAEVEKQVGGTAAATGDSSAKIKLAFGEIVEKIGAALLPALDSISAIVTGKVLPAVDRIGVVMKENKEIFIAIAAVIAGVGAAFIVASVALKAYHAVQVILKAASAAMTAAQWALNAAMAANPIVLVVIAIAALVAALVIAYQKSETFRAIVTKAWEAIKSATKSVFEWVQNKITAVFGFLKTLFLNFTGPGLIIKHWDTIKDKTAAAFEAVRTVVQNKFDAVKGFFTGLRDTAGNAVGSYTGAGGGILGKLHDMVTAVTGMSGKISAAAAGMWDGLKDSFRSAINAMIGWWNNLSFALDIPDKIPGLPDSFTISTPNIPYLADGGIVTRPTLAVIGEAGPEAVIPLNGRHGFGGGVAHITLKLTAQEIDQLSRGRAYQADLDAYARAGGR